MAGGVQHIHQFFKFAQLEVTERRRIDGAGVCRSVYGTGACRRVDAAPDS
jgi:hypothetical protein